MKLVQRKGILSSFVVKSFYSDRKQKISTNVGQVSRNFYEIEAEIV